MKSLTKSEATEIVQQKSTQSFKGDNLNKRLEQDKTKRTSNRYKVINISRTNNEGNDDEDSSKLTVFDVEKHEITENNEEKSLSSANDKEEKEFVYDVYMAIDQNNKISYSDDLDLNELSIMDYDDYMYAFPRLTSNADDEDSMNDDDEDSNDENYWRNDYPDEEDFSDDESINERDMRRAIGNLDVEDDLSSDEDFVTFDDDVDNDGEFDIANRYAKYKRRVLSELNYQNSTNEDSD